MAACGAKNFHKVNFDLSAVWLDFASVFGQIDVHFSSFYLRFWGKAADMTFALRMSAYDPKRAN